MIKLSLDEKMLFVNSYLINEINLGLLNIKPNKIYVKNILTNFEYLLQLSDEKILFNWQKSLGNLKVDLTDLKERIINTKNGKVLIGIRFLGMDISKPFINVWANYSLENNLDEIIEIAKKEFNIFKPKHIRFWTNPKSPKAIKYKQYSHQNILVNSIKTICKQDLPINYDSISLVLVENDRYYPFYEKVYKEFHRKNPKLKAYVSLNSRDVMNDCLTQNLLYYIVYRKEKIGLISAEKYDIFGEKSLHVTEIVIDSKYKGKKLATATQRKFIETVKADFKYIWGEIDSINVPSLKNALRVGRKIVSTEILLPI